MTEERQESTDFELMDKEDEEQILQELRGVPVEKFIYKNSRGQQELSYAGTKWVVRQMANMGEAIRVDLPKKERCPIDPEYILVDIIGKRVKIDRDANCETMLDTNVGSARGWCKQKLKDGRVVPDEFFYNKTVSKATRNVLQMLIPPDLKREMISRLEKMQGAGGNRPPQGRPPGAPQQQQRPPGAPPQQQQRPPGPPQQQQAPPQQQRPPAPTGRPPTGGFAGEAPFPASPSQDQAPPPPPQRQAPPPPQQQQQRPPAPPPQQQRQAPPPPPPQQQRQAPPPQQQRPPAPPPQRQAPPPPPPQQQQLRQQVPHTTQSRPDQAPREAAIDVLQQRFEIVLKQAAQTNDRNQALTALYALTGYQKITDLPKELIVEMGPVLHKVAKGELRMENGQISDFVTGEIMYPKQAPQYEEPLPPQVDPPMDEPPQQPQAPEPMF